MVGVIVVMNSSIPTGCFLNLSKLIFQLFLCQICFLPCMQSLLIYMCSISLLYVFMLINDNSGMVWSCL